MTEDQKAAYVYASATAALAETVGMHWENVERDRRGESIAWSKDAFDKLIESYGIHYNAMMSLFHDQ
jgi:Mn-dependent DtxR family transcriptional regulator